MNAIMLEEIDEEFRMWMDVNSCLNIIRLALPLFTTQIT